MIRTRCEPPGSRQCLAIARLRRTASPIGCEMGLSYGKEIQHGANKAFGGRAQIARAVLEIVATKGAHALTAMEIAKRVGVSDAALFRHFADKVEIIEAAVQVFEELRFESFPP